MSPGRARIVFMGTPRFAVPSLKALIEAGHDVAAAVTQPDKPRGRGLAPAPSPVKVLAEQSSIPVLQPERLRDGSFMETLQGLAPEFIAVVAYGKILPASILSIPPQGCVNLHASLLPKYRGAAPINWAIIRGETETGACTMLMDEGMDTGPVLLCERTAIGPEDTAEDLAIRLSESGALLLAKTIRLLTEGAVVPVSQDDSLATAAPILRKEDGLIDWTTAAAEVGCHVRGFYPWPGAFTRRGASILKVHRGRPLDAGYPGAAPGTVIDASREGVKVACASGAYLITELQPENKRRMSASEFVAGYRVERGERLG